MKLVDEALVDFKKNAEGFPSTLEPYEAVLPPWWYVFLNLPDMCLLGADIYEYNYVSQGKITIPNVDDGEELQLTDVSESVNPVVTTQELLILLLGRLVSSSFRSFDVTDLSF